MFEKIFVTAKSQEGAKLQVKITDQAQSEFRDVQLAPLHLLRIHACQKRVPMQQQEIFGSTGRLVQREHTRDPYSEASVSIREWDQQA